jgi:leucine dehydrogenase
MNIQQVAMGGSLTELFRGFEDVRIYDNPQLGFTAIIAVHSTVLGPSLGGCRRMQYSLLWDAYVDVSRLARGMTYKSALAGLALGGGKCVMIPWKKEKRLRRKQFLALGAFVDAMNGTYISAEDVGVNVLDINAMARNTRNVTGNMKEHPYHGDPSPYTAYGVLHGMLGTLRAKNGPDAVLAGRSVYVEGIGKVGFALAGLLHKEGARLYVSNRTETQIERDALTTAVSRFGATVVPLGKDGRPEVFPYVEIYAPCALGGVVSEERIATFPFSLEIIAGSANNVLLDASRDGDSLRLHGILYAPDYAINNGGIRDVYHQLRSQRDGIPYSAEAVFKECATNAQLLYWISVRALAEGKCPHQVADEMAEKRIAEKQCAYHSV